jgi:guanylate kinase
MILVITAPSGAGKTTILRELLKIFPDLNFSVSAATRKKRDNETEGKDYYFISEEEFRSKINNDEFVEWEEVHGNYYGTLKSEIEKFQKNSRDLFLDVDVKGALSIKKLFPDAHVFFINVPKEELIRRLKGRKTETEEQINKRAERIEFESGLKDKFDYVIDNNSTPGGLKKAIEEISEIINKIKKK